MLPQTQMTYGKLSSSLGLISPICKSYLVHIQVEQYS